MSMYVIDLGNGDYKVGSDKTEGIISYPAVIGGVSSYNSLNIGSGSNKLHNMTLRKDNREYAFGDMAVKNSLIRNHNTTEDKYTSPDSLLLSTAALAMLSDQMFDSGNLIIGLPLHKMNVASSIAEHYKGRQFAGSIGYFGEYGGNRTVKINNVVPVAQPHGTLFNLILDARGEIANKELASKGVAIYDIGFKTNDGVVFRNLETIGRLTINSKNGIFVAYEEIRNAINNNFNGLEVKPFEVPEVIKTGKVKGISVTNIINEAMYNLASNIILELKSKWHDAWEIEQTVFTGGGAVLLRPYLQQAFTDAIYKDAKSNAEGMLKYAKRLWGRGA